MRFKSKPVETTYLEAIRDTKTGNYHAHVVDKSGKPVGDKGVFNLSPEQMDNAFDLIPPRGPNKPKEVAPNGATTDEVNA